jgi:hypothetical protein
MYKITTLFLLLQCYLLQAQDKITFAYDNAGNQVLREICVNCNARTIAKPIKELKKEDLQEIDQISYYPNPVSEELYINWELVPGKKVIEIKLLSINGKVLQTHFPTEKQMSIGFQNYPSGLYLVQFTYTTNEQSVIKIIKK